MRLLASPEGSQVVQTFSLYALVGAGIFGEMRHGIPFNTNQHEKLVQRNVHGDTEIFHDENLL